MTTANTKIRNAANTAWVTGTQTNFRVRNPTSTGWLYPLATGGGTISGMSVGALVPVMDVSTNPAHQTLSDGYTSYGLWLDGYLNPYRDGAGNVYIPLPSSENYRFKVNNWDNGAGWVLQGPTMLSGRNTVEAAYNSRNWIFGHWSEGNNVYALMHHEWYQSNKVVDGIDAFNAHTYGFNTRWVNAVGWAYSTNGGVTFNTSAATNSSRLVLVPEPWGIQQKNHMYGFFHPSNIVKEGAYYYACVEQRSLAAGGTTVNTGMSLIRTTNVAQPTGWQFWDGAGWQTVNHNDYQGNNAAQVPHMFFPVNNINIYSSAAFNSAMGQSLRYHTPSGQWVVFGYAGTTSSVFCYSTSSTLANPTFTSLVGITTPNPGDYVTAGGKYISVFDANATDNNFQNIGNTCVVLTTADWAVIKKGTLTITT